MKFRDVTIKDADFLLELKNDPEVRKWAIVTHDEIKYEDHIKWLSNKLKEKIKFYIILKHGKPVGDLRIESDGEISVRICKKERGKGYATTAVGMIKDKVYAKIVEGNLASINLFIKNGFKFTSYENGFYVLKKSNDNPILRQTSSMV